jgi:hypothetical protein
VRPRSGDRDLAIRALIVLFAVAVCATAFSRPASTVLAAVAAIAVLERLVRTRRRGRLDAVLVGVGGLLVALILLGLVLDALPGGLTRLSWSIGTGVLGLLTLAWCRHRSADPAFDVGRRPGRAAAVWSAAALGLTTAAVVISVTSANAGESAPLQLSVPRVSAGHAEVVVQAGASAGRYELLAGTGAGQRVVRGPFAVAAGQSVTTAVALPADTRIRIELASVSPRKVVRFVILDNTGS